jgi:hypothetical protein
VSPRRRLPSDAAPQRLIDVSVQYSIRLPVKSDDMDAQREAMERGRKMLYQMGGSECSLMMATISTSCRLDRLNVQGNIMRQRGDEEMLSLSATAQYKIGLKPSP